MTSLVFDNAQRPFKVSSVQRALLKAYVDDRQHHGDFPACLVCLQMSMLATKHPALSATNTVIMLPPAQDVLRNFSRIDGVSVSEVIHAGVRAALKPNIIPEYMLMPLRHDKIWSLLFIHLAPHTAYQYDTCQIYDYPNTSACSASATVRRADGRNSKLARTVLAELTSALVTLDLLHLTPAQAVERRAEMRIGRRYSVFRLRHVPTVGGLDPWTSGVFVCAVAALCMELVAMTGAPRATTLAFAAARITRSMVTEARSLLAEIERLFEAQDDGPIMPEAAENGARRVRRVWRPPVGAGILAALIMASQTDLVQTLFEGML